jgi:hypothetical protein
LNGGARRYIALDFDESHILPHIDRDRPIDLKGLISSQVVDDDPFPSLVERSFC